jgi:hypothetical protein
MEKTEFSTFNELRQPFPSADRGGDLVVFYIGSNNYRLFASIHFNRKKVYIRHVLTHSEYDKERGKNDRNNSRHSNSLAGNSAVYDHPIRSGLRQARRTNERPR